MKNSGQMQSKRFIGVDLHRDCFTTCVLSSDGKTALAEWQLEDLSRFAKSLRKTDSLAVETTGNARLFHDAVEKHVSRVVVVNTHKFKLISSSVKKTDANDAKLLATYLSNGILPEVRMKDKAHVQMASLTQTRDKLVKLRTVLKNKVSGITSSHGHNLPRESLSAEKNLQAVLGLRFDAMEMFELRILVEQIRSLNKSISEIEDMISAEGQKLDGFENLKSIKGIGDVSASIMLTTIGNVNDFADEGKLASYFGIVPRVHNSNETNRSGRITKMGCKLVRTSLVQCALIAKRYSSYLSNYYDGIKSRRGGGKAIIALARKFLGIIYRTLKNNWVFTDFTKYEHAPLGAQVAVASGGGDASGKSKRRISAQEWIESGSRSSSSRSSRS